MQTQEINK